SRGWRSNVGTGWPDWNATTPPGSSSSVRVGWRFALPPEGTRLQVVTRGRNRSRSGRATTPRRRLVIFASKVRGHVCSGGPGTAREASGRVDVTEVVWSRDSGGRDRAGAAASFRE